MLFCSNTKYIYFFIISYDYGYLSALVSKRIFKIIMSAQIEMYLIQIKVDITFEKYFGKKFNTKISSEIIFFIKLSIIFCISYIYRNFYRDKFAIILMFFADVYGIK